MKNILSFFQGFSKYLLEITADGKYLVELNINFLIVIWHNIMKISSQN